MFTCTVDLSELKRLAKLSVEAVHNGVKDAVRNAAEEGAEHAKAVGKFQDRTGNLRRSIKADPVSSNIVGAKWMIYSNMPYAAYVENGTKAHEIWPRASHGLKGPVRNGQTRRATGKGPHEHIVGRGRALRWVNGGKTFFAAHVRHPGSAAMPYMGPAYLKAEAVLYRELELIGDRLTRIWR